MRCHKRVITIVKVYRLGMEDSNVTKLIAEAWSSMKGMNVESKAFTTTFLWVLSNHNYPWKWVL